MQSALWRMEVKIDETLQAQHLQSFVPVGVLCVPYYRLLYERLNFAGEDKVC